jgi:hypothetical protein
MHNPENPNTERQQQAASSKHTFPNRHNGDFRFVKLPRGKESGTWLPELSEVKSTLTTCTAKRYCEEPEPMLA